MSSACSRAATASGHEATRFGLALFVKKPPALPRLFDTQMLSMDSDAWF